MATSFETEYSLAFSDIRELIADAIARAKAVPSGTKFKISELYTGIGWNQLPTGMRKKAGLYLTSMAIYQEGTSEAFLALGPKATSGQQVYIRL